MTVSQNNPPERYRGKDYAISGLVAIISANLIWGISDVAISYLERGLLTVALCGLGGFVVLIIIQLIKGTPLSFRDFLHAFPIGLQRSVIWAGLFIAFEKDNPAIATTIFSFSLVVAVVVFGPLVGEKITVRIVVISLVGVLGVVLTSNESFMELKFSTASWIVLAMLPISAAGTYLLRDLQKRVPAESSATYYFLWVGIIMTPISLFMSPRFEFRNLEFAAMIAMFITGALGHYLYSISQKNTTFQFNAVASSIHSPATAICAWLFLDSKLAFHQWVGMVIVIGVVAYISISAKSKEIQELDETLSTEL